MSEGKGCALRWLGLALLVCLLFWAVLLVAGWAFLGDQWTLA